MSRLMSLLREWMIRLRETLRPRRSDADLHEELRVHLDMAGEDLRRQDDAPGGARRAAIVRSGGPAQAMEALRDQRGLPWLTDVRGDLRYACRALVRARGFSSVAVLSLAFGIGGTTAIFSLINTLMLRSLPVRAPHELAELLSRYPVSRSSPASSTTSTSVFAVGTLRFPNSPVSLLRGSRLAARAATPRSSTATTSPVRSSRCWGSSRRWAV